jgi:membrane-bound metal-dependent hydrolase YbcI (DUF457 family)
MPSPIGHAIAGISIAFAADPDRRLSGRWPRLLLTCSLLAALPDLDLIVPGAHRRISHSLLAVGVVAIAAAVITRVRAGRLDWRVTLVAAAAYGSHLLTDYFGVDPGTPAGIQLLWPREQWFISDWSIFLGTERHAPLSAFAILMNALALARELVVLGPILLLTWLRRQRLGRAARVDEQAT